LFRTRKSKIAIGVGHVSGCLQWKRWRGVVVDKVRKCFLVLPLLLPNTDRPLTKTRRYSLVRYLTGTCCRSSSYESLTWNSQRCFLCYEIIIYESVNSLNQSDIARGNIFLSLLSRANEERGVHVPWFSQGWLKSVCFSNSYNFICYLIHHGNSTQL
jgi:hypothetical protein